MPFKEYKEPESYFIEIASSIGINVSHPTRQNQKDVLEYLKQDDSLDKERKEGLSPI